MSRYTEGQSVKYVVDILRQGAARIAKKQRQINDHELLILDQPTSDDGNSSMADFVEDPSTSVEDQALSDLDVEGLLARLPSKQRRVIFLVVICQMTQRKAAAQMGISLKAVNTLKHKALVSLRAKIAKAGRR